MKTVSKSILFATLLLSACSGGTVDESAASAMDGQPATKTTATVAGSKTEVKIMKDGEALASYDNTYGEAAVDKEGQTIGLSLNSADNKHTLMLVVEDTKAGVYPLRGGWGEKDQVSVMFITDVLPTPSLAFEKGEINITELTDKYCSGTFKATGTAGSKKGYSVEAVFTKLPVVPTAKNDPRRQ
jgi:hypothetical protein